MRHGFVKVAAVTPDIRVADVRYNCEEICKKIKEAEKSGAKIIVFPELCLTGYTCGDLYAQDLLIREAEKAILKIAQMTEGSGTLIVVGLPVSFEGKLYNAAAVLNDGKILGFTTRSGSASIEEMYLMRQFSEGPEKAVRMEFAGEEVLLGSHILYRAAQMPELTIAVEIGEDAWSLNPPSVRAVTEGATLIVNCGASDDIVGKREYREMMLKAQSSRLAAGYIFAGAGQGESTTDIVYSGHSLIVENGVLLEESSGFVNEIVCSEIDVFRLQGERKKNSSFRGNGEKVLPCIRWNLKMEDTVLTRKTAPSPFIPEYEEDRESRCEEILNIQALGLKKRLLHTNAKTAVIGISGGLDSTLAILVTARAFDMIGKERKDMIAVTMPCYGTTDRTYNNACKMTKKLGATLIEVPIAESVDRHFKDIGHDKSVHDVTFENAQARERTQVLMDIANREGGMVIGTGDLSELALGWATYNGDHMSMYGVNGDVPKTLVRHLVNYYAMSCGDMEMREVLLDVLDTPVSPELLPPSEGKIAQKTEDLVGPYELHDFFIYYMLRFGFEPSKIYRLAQKAFEGVYTDEIILKWLKTFCRRFFSQQFKRSCLPDGPKVGTVGISPRGGLHMPSDACAALWMKDLEEL